MPALVDSNVLLDIFTRDKAWYAWSSTALSEYVERGLLYINPVIYTEISIGFATIEALEDALPAEYFQREHLPYEAAFLAGKCFARYRKTGGIKHAPLPDFYIGAHAAVRGWELLTRDKGRYATYFPTVKLIAP